MSACRRDKTNLLLATDYMWQLGRISYHHEPFISSQLILYAQPLLYMSKYQVEEERYDNFYQEQFIIFDRPSNIIIFFQKQITYITGQKQVFIKLKEILLIPSQFSKIFICARYDFECIFFEPLLTLKFDLNKLIFQQKQLLCFTHLNFKFEQHQEIEIQLDKVFFGRLVLRSLPSLSSTLNFPYRKKIQLLMIQKFIGFWSIEKINFYLEKLKRLRKNKAPSLGLNI